MANDNKTNTGSKTSIHDSIHENFRSNGTQTPVYKKPAPMPPIKPAKPETNKK